MTQHITFGKVIGSYKTRLTRFFDVLLIHPNEIDMIRISPNEMNISSWLFHLADENKLNTDESIMSRKVSKTVKYKREEINIRIDGRENKRVSKIQKK